MKATLYQLSKRVESDCEELRGLDDSVELDVTRLQKIFFKRYEGNSVLDDAMQGRQSIEESLRELGEKNRGIRKIIPWRKDSEHNERLGYMAELVPGTEHLKTSGIFYPDNLITATAEMGLLFAGMTYLMVKYLFIPNGSLSPAEYQQVVYNMQVIFPVAVGAVSGLFGGLFVSDMLPGLLFRRGRFGSLPIEPAKYLDEIVK